jgi:hypothetical protein
MGSIADQPSVSQRHLLRHILPPLSGRRDCQVLAPSPNTLNPHRINALIYKYLRKKPVFLPKPALKKDAGSGAAR